ncbi:GNAT family N-acetyltransferase [Halorubrum sp. BOL3-1]|nr:GNAT family N-acetyltransferase [Halorubrum sp. BOL3-1]
MPSVTLHPFGGEFEYLEALLRRNELPVSDLREAPAKFYHATSEGERVGAGGFEVHGEAGLLRSLVVEDPKRGRGYGSDLCELLESEARTAGIETLYLLTTTASEFFVEEGYVAVDRETTPESIRNTTQFEELCPQSATCLRKSLVDK